MAILVVDVSAQQIVFYGAIKDVKGDPVQNVKVFCSANPDHFVRSDEKGKFSIECNPGSGDSLFFRSVRFDPYAELISRRMRRKAQKNGDSLYLEVVMPDKTLDIFTVRPTLPDTIVGTQEYSVADYDFMQDGRLILLTYEKNMRSGTVLRLMDENQQEIDHYYVLGDAVELKKDFRGNVHLLCEERVYLIRIVNNQIHTLLESRDYYFKYLAPILDSIGDCIYYSNYSDIYPAFDYFEFNREDSTYKTILQIEDTFMMEFYRAEFKYVDVRTKLWAHNKQLETGIDKEIWVGATVFTNSIYYQPVYAPLFKTGEDTIVVFDHYKNKMFRYTPFNGFVDSTRISYHLHARKSGWEQPLLGDKATGKVYAMFEKGGYTYLSEIDKEKGIVKESFKLYFKYVEQIQIVNGKVYYIYRPFESIQKKYIYAEDLS